jgi:CRP/FNR family transcriptional regulator, cyclic AMP receptor protein
MSEPVPGRTCRYARAVRYQVGVIGGRAFVMDEDRELGELVAPTQAGAARQGSLAQVLDIPPGRWDARTEADRARHGYGLLVLEGLLIRRVGYAGRFGAELLSAGDLLRPWEFDGDDTVGFETTWRILTGSRLAVLDLRWAERMAHYPRIGPALAGRALYRSRRVTAMMAISQQPRLDDRLWMLFWELADRHGRVHPDGVHIDLPLTHEVLSHLVAARRPSVSGALTKLAGQGRVCRNGRAWVLRGEPPANV